VTSYAACAAITTSSLRWTAVSNSSTTFRRFPYGVVLVRAASNRMQHLRPLVPTILDAIATTKPGQLQRVGA